MTHRILLFAGLICCLMVDGGRAGTADQVLASMDQASSSFQGMTAQLKRVDHTAVINDTTEETGIVRMKKSSQQDVQMLVEFGEPDTRTVAFEKRKAEIYYPKIKTVHVYDLGKYRQLVDQFLLLGFGTSGNELKQNYAVKLLGEEQVGGEPTARLELIPKSASAKEHLKKVELWISSKGYPLQQKFYKPSGDYTLIGYSNLQINPGLPASALKLDVPPGVKREYPQR